MAQGFTYTLTPVAVPLAATLGTHLPRDTAYDVMELLLGQAGGEPDLSWHRDIKRSILAAHREFAAIKNWTYFITHGRLLLHGAQTTGSITYDHTGGAYERLVTIAGATWPSWTDRGTLRINDVIYEIESVIDSTKLTLTSGANPGADLASGTVYQLAQDTYPLPADFLAGDRGEGEGAWGGMDYVEPRDWFSEVRHDSGNTGTPCRYTFTGDPRGNGGLVLRVNASPDADKTLDFVYKRAMRPIRTWDAKEGTASVAQSNTVVTLGGTGQFKAAHQGAVLRFSSNSQTVPDGLDSPDAYVLERTIVSILSATTAQLDEAADQTLTGVKYRISDPIDLENQAMLNAFISGARRWLAIYRNRDDVADLTAIWERDVAMAKDADSRDIGRRSASIGGGYSPTLSMGRRGPDVE